MSKVKKFQKIVTEIEYFGEHKLKWWQKFFYNPPREFNGKLFNSRNIAMHSDVPDHKQFGQVFSVSMYTSHTRRINL